MDWCRLGTSYYLDAAVLRAGEAAEVLFLRCIAYSGAKESRGRIDKAVLPMLTPSKTQTRVDALLREELLVDEGSTVFIRSWAHWQEALDVEADRRRKDRDRKRDERAAVRAASEDVSKDSPGTVQAVSSRKEVEVEVEVDTPTVSARKRATAAPDLFPITEQMADWGRQHCPLVLNPEAETRQFLDHHRAKGAAFKDWSAAWRTWMGNAQKYAERDGVRRVSPGSALVLTVDQQRGRRL